MPSSASTIQEATNAAVRKAFGSVRMAVDVMVNSCSLVELLMQCAAGGWSLEAVPLWSSVWRSGLRHVHFFFLHLYFGGSYFEEPEIFISEMKTAIGLGSKLRDVHNKDKVQAWCST